MAGHSVRPASIGVGPALRRAREIAGITLDEAARDTRLTPDQIGSLEREDFDLLGEEVYVRAMLRTYAQYLGLKPDKVMSAYAKHAEEPELPSPPAKMGRVEQALAAARIRDNQRFLLIAAAIILIAAVAVGIVSRGGDDTHGNDAVRITDTRSGCQRHRQRDRRGRRHGDDRRGRPTDDVTRARGVDLVQRGGGADRFRERWGGGPDRRGRSHPRRARTSRPSLVRHVPAVRRDRRAIAVRPWL